MGGVIGQTHTLVWYKTCALGVTIASAIYRVGNRDVCNFISGSIYRFESGLSHKVGANRWYSCDAILSGPVDVEFMLIHSE